MVTQEFSYIMARRVFGGEEVPISYYVALLQPPSVLYSDPELNPAMLGSEILALELSGSNTGYARRSLPSSWVITGESPAVVATLTTNITWTNEKSIPPDESPTPWDAIGYYAVVIRWRRIYVVGWFDKVAEEPIILQRQDTLTLPSQRMTLNDGMPIITQ